MPHSRLAALVAIALFSACSSSETAPDAGTPADAGTDAGPALAPPGGACTADADCAGPDAHCRTQLPGGYCVRDNCTKNSDCGTDGVCEEDGAGVKHCYEGCSSSADCSRESAGYRCDIDHTCWWPDYLPANPGKAATGAPCSGGNDCESGSCLPAATTTDEFTGYTDGYCSLECADDSDCASDAKCFRGLCRKKCANDAGCRGPDYACLRSLCLRNPARVTLGAACTDATENAACGFGTCLDDGDNTPGFPGGYCSVVGDCNPIDGSGCGAGGECFAVDATPSAPRYCLDKCATDGDCRAGYACDDTLGVKVCLIKPANPADVKIGSACSVDSDCDEVAGARGLCFKTASFPNGYCVSPGCTADADGNNDSCAPGGGTCVLIGDAAPGFCLAACDSDSDCRQNEGYVCTDDGFCDYP